MLNVQVWILDLMYKYLPITPVAWPCVIQVVRIDIFLIYAQAQSLPNLD